MATPNGAAIYGDIAYWSYLMENSTIDHYRLARLKLVRDLKNYPVVANRLMYGSDWLMLSQEMRWDRYPFDVLAVLPAGYKPDDVFAGNAK